MDVLEIEIIINKQGQVEIQVHGVKGKSCLDITAAVEAALGGEVLVREMTADANAETQNPIDMTPPLKTN